jgi:predicted ATP-dependent endonuclease of OLD family
MALFRHFLMRSQRVAEALPIWQCVPICNLALPERTLDKVSRYPDVMRSALLSGPRALLVEGVAESLLLPVLAQRIILKDSPDALQRFKGAVIAAIEASTSSHILRCF